MGHKADSTFFDAKHPWSKRKDLILSYYLRPYLAKVATLGRPILVVDGFAGRGQCRDGSPGSPLLIAKAVKEVVAQGISIQQLCVESDEDLFTELKTFTQQYTFIDQRHSTFNDVVPEVERYASHMTVFLYLDPYTVEGLEWAALDSILKHLQVSGSSVELLLNFNAYSFARRARSALKIAQPELDESTGDADLMDTETIESTTTDKLDRIVGGGWWREVLEERLDFPSEVTAITQEFASRLRERFQEVYEHPIKAHWRHIVPKYSLIFGSRSPDATVLINDAVVKSVELWADETAPAEASLFEKRPTDVVPDPNELPQIVLRAADARMPRNDLIVKVIRQNFGTYSETNIRQTIAKHIKNRRMASASGRTRINGAEHVWRL